MFIFAGPEALSQGVSFNARHETAKLENALKDMTAAKRQCRSHMLRTSQDLLRREERAAVLSMTGGSAGMMEFSATGRLVVASSKSKFFI